MKKKFFFKDIPINAHFYVVEDGKVMGYHKSSYDTGVENFGRKIKEFNLYDEIYVVSQPKFILNY